MGRSSLINGQVVEAPLVLGREVVDRHADVVALAIQVTLRRRRANIIAVTSLMSASDPPSARCSHCGAIAAGPCARCRRPTCGDCCELTEGGATTFAVCLACVKRGGKSLIGAYAGFLLWLGGIILALALVAALLLLLRR